MRAMPQLPLLQLPGRRPRRRALGRPERSGVR